MSSTNSQQQARKAESYLHTDLPGFERTPEEEAKAKDFYGTPAEAFLPLLPYLPRAGTIHEPCCGDGRLVQWMRNDGLLATGADLRDIGEIPFCIERFDFLDDWMTSDHIVTNPPFSLALEILDHAFKIVRQPAGEIWMLLRLNFLGSKKRKEWWQAHEPDAIFVLSDRPDFTGDGGDSCEYAWFAWQQRFKGIYHL